jgi:glycosyltransferase involved in cell wall biosynthesis
MISFVVPAHDEEALLPATLRALRASAQTLKAPFEIVVVDDASTDATAAIARSLADRVVQVKLRQIAGTRNAGAREARGDVLVFVDADTLVGPATLHAMARALARGAVGGGAWVEVDAATPAWGRALTWLVVVGYAGLAGYAGGCFLYARRADFEAVGGFDETYYASEEVHLSRALKRRGRFVVVRPPVVTSGRKLRMVSPGRLLRMHVPLLTRGWNVLRSRDGLGLWYGEGLRDAPSGGRVDGA